MRRLASKPTRPLTPCAIAVRREDCHSKAHIQTEKKCLYTCRKHMNEMMGVFSYSRTSDPLKPLERGSQTIIKGVRRVECLTVRLIALC